MPSGLLFNESNVELSHLSMRLSIHPSIHLSIHPSIFFDYLFYLWKSSYSTGYFLLALLWERFPIPFQVLFVTPIFLQMNLIVPCWLLLQSETEADCLQVLIRFLVVLIIANWFSFSSSRWMPMVRRNRRTNICDLRMRSTGPTNSLWTKRSSNSRQVLLLILCSAWVTGQSHKRSSWQRILLAFFARPWQGFW